MGNRVFYAIQQVGLAGNNISSNLSPIHGIQSVSLTSNYNISPISEFARLAIYDTIEDSNEFGITIKKVLDGYPLLYTSATAETIYPTLQYRLLTTSNAAVSVFNENEVSFATGHPLSIMFSSGLSITSLRYNFNVNGSFEEEISLVGNDKIWSNDTGLINGAYTYLINAIPTNNLMPGGFDNTDSPIGTGGVNRRENMPFGNSIDLTTLPQDLPPDAHVQNISISANISREAIPQLGNNYPAGRPATFPIEVTTEIGVISTSGEMVSLTTLGRLTYNPLGDDICRNAHDVSGQVIRIATCEGTRIYLGNKNKLTSINYTGGDTGGGNVALSYTYKGYNNLTVLHPTDTNTNFWEERNIWLSGNGDADGILIDALGLFTFGINQGVTSGTGHLEDLQTRYIKLDTQNWDSGIFNTDKVAFNFSVDFNYEQVTGIILEARPVLFNNISYNNSFLPIWTGTIRNQIAPGKFLFNLLEDNSGVITNTSRNTLFPSGYSSDTSYETEYQYRVRGIVNNYPTIPLRQTGIINIGSLIRPTAFRLYTENSLSSGLIWDNLGLYPNNDTIFTLTAQEAYIQNTEDTNWEIDNELHRRSLSFNGSNGWVSGEILSQLNGDSTLFSWINCANLSIEDGIICCLKSSAPWDNGITFSTTASSFDGPGAYASSFGWWGTDDIIATDTWIPVILRVDGDVGITMHIGDNIYILSDTSSNIVTPTENLRIGKSYSNVFFDGKLSDQMIWNRALSDNEISALKDMNNTNYTYQGKPLIIMPENPVIPNSFIQPGHMQALASDRIALSGYFQTLLDNGLNYLPIAATNYAAQQVLSSGEHDYYFRNWLQGQQDIGNKPFFLWAAFPYVGGWGTAGYNSGGSGLNTAYSGYIYAQAPHIYEPGAIRSLDDYEDYTVFHTRIIDDAIASGSLRDAVDATYYKPTGSTYNVYSYLCPNYTGTLYQGELKKIEEYFKWLRPQALFINYEAFASPVGTTSLARAWTPSGGPFIPYNDIWPSYCTRCQSRAGVRSGLNRGGKDITDLFHKYVPKGVVISYFTFDGFPVNKSPDTDNSHVPFFGATTNITTPNPACYTMMYDGNDGTTATYLYPDVEERWEYWKAGGDGTKPDLTAALQPHNLKNGYMWVSIYKNIYQSASGYFSDEQFYKLCKKIANAGAYGICIIEQYSGRSGTIPAYLELDTNVLRLMNTGLQAFN